MSGRGNVVGSKCPVREVSIGEVSCRGTVWIPIYQLNFLRGTALKSSIKEQWPALFVQNPAESLFLKVKQILADLEFLKKLPTYQ